MTSEKESFIFLYCINGFRLCTTDAKRIAQYPNLINRTIIQYKIYLIPKRCEGSGIKVYLQNVRLTAAGVRTKECTGNAQPAAGVPNTKGPHPFLCGAMF
jgi:hypothetical protein